MQRAAPSQPCADALEAFPRECRDQSFACGCGAPGSRADPYAHTCNVQANTHTDTDTEHGAPRADPRCLAISSKWITCSGHAWGGMRVHCSALKTLDCIPERLVAQDTSKGGPWQRLWVLERDALSSIACAPAPSAPVTTSGVFGYMHGFVRATMGGAGLCSVLLVSFANEANTEADAR